MVTITIPGRPPTYRRARSNGARRHHDKRTIADRERIALAPLTEMHARLDLAHLAGLALEIDRQIATQPRRLAKRWRWSIVGVKRFMSAEAVRKVRA